MTHRAISRIGGWLALFYPLAFAFLFLRDGVGDGGAFLGTIVMAAWITAPAICAAAFVAASPTRFGATIFLAFEIVLIVSTVLFVRDIWLHGNSTSSVALLFLPLPQWGAVIVAFLISLACGWRMRPDFLKD